MGDVIKGLFKPKQKNLSKFFYNTLVNVLKFSDEEAKVLMNKYGFSFRYCFSSSSNSGYVIVVSIFSLYDILSPYFYIDYTYL